MFYNLDLRKWEVKEDFLRREKRDDRSYMMRPFNGKEVLSWKRGAEFDTSLVGILEEEVDTLLFAATCFPHNFTSYELANVSALDEQVIVSPLLLLLTHVGVFLSNDVAGVSHYSFTLSSYISLASCCLQTPERQLIHSRVCIRYLSLSSASSLSTSFSLSSCRRITFSVFHLISFHSQLAGDALLSISPQYHCPLLICASLAALHHLWMNHKGQALILLKFMDWFRFSTLCPPSSSTLCSPVQIPSTSHTSSSPLSSSPPTSPQNSLHSPLLSQLDLSSSTSAHSLIPVPAPFSCDLLERLRKNLTLLLFHEIDKIPSHEKASSMESETENRRNETKDEDCNSSRADGIINFKALDESQSLVRTFPKVLHDGLNKSSNFPVDFINFKEMKAILSPLQLSCRLMREAYERYTKEEGKMKGRREGNAVEYPFFLLFTPFSREHESMEAIYQSVWDSQCFSYDFTLEEWIESMKNPGDLASLKSIADCEIRSFFSSLPSLPSSLFLQFSLSKHVRREGEDSESGELCSPPDCSFAEAIFSHISSHRDEMVEEALCLLFWKLMGNLRFRREKVEIFDNVHKETHDRETTILSGECPSCPLQDSLVAIIVSLKFSLSPLVTPLSLAVYAAELDREGRAGEALQLYHLAETLYSLSIPNPIVSVSQPLVWTSSLSSRSSVPFLLHSSSSFPFARFASLSLDLASVNSTNAQDLHRFKCVPVRASLSPADPSLFLFFFGSSIHQQYLKSVGEYAAAWLSSLSYALYWGEGPVGGCIDNCRWAFWALYFAGIPLTYLAQAISAFFSFSCNETVSREVGAQNFGEMKSFLSFLSRFVFFQWFFCDD